MKQHHGLFLAIFGIGDMSVGRKTLFNFFFP